ncbi:Myosin light chain kinase 2, skeletal/cardiac muscle-like [Oopsacas minuta]|uniref:Myosin light chain kinase 2, skeletal/cardiac muscle-like n=1 Tax=Oopsacas minuta TaxID=111878 RepID=A0AAV7JRW9_9METZ|nr:Myosin light chain kinase 2, skeletal/cardiac muscle-like [Oopsacas minuta]
MYILLSGYYPFGGNSENETRSKVLTASYSFAYSTFLTISKASKMCIGSLLEVDPAARLSAAQCLLAVSSSDVVKLKSKVISSKPLKDYLVHRYMQIQLT